MTRWFVVLLAASVLMMTGESVNAQRTFDANWIWLKSDSSQAATLPEKAWFRREVRSYEPATGIAYVACDGVFTLWVNGTKVGSGDGVTMHRFNLNGIVGAQTNVIAIQAENKGGQAGLYIDGEIRGQSGTAMPFDSDAQWLATNTAPQGDSWLKPGFDDRDWGAVKVIGPHETSLWKDILMATSELDHLEAAPGFVLERIAEPELVGSIISITWGNRDRLIAAQERGPILSLIDEDKDGTYEKVVEYSTDVQNCQGLCMVGDDLYAVGDGPQGTAMYRLPDRNGDDKADEVQLVRAYTGSKMADHGPHDVLFGPDGWLYNNVGNHTTLPEHVEPDSPLRDYYEGTVLLPKFEDASGHANGVKAPGGTIWRFTEDGKNWWCETAGFRNEYDIAFNQNGDMFTFDSDMEWDVGLPWYRPVRINHCIPGAEFGWRSGCAKWPSEYFDSLPSVVDVGRGSPTGVVVYDHTTLPEKYHGSLIVCDWSMGRILAVRLEPDGATFTGEFEDIVTGNPLNVSDIEIDRDGSIVYSTGGRGTEGGIYRISAQNNEKPTAATATTIEQLLDLPQLQAGWARDTARDVKNTSGDRWESTLEKVAQEGTAAHQIRALTLLSQLGPPPKTETLLALGNDSDASVRAFATWLLGSRTGDSVRKALSQSLTDSDPVVRRRACEAFVRSGLEAPVEPLIEIMGSDDRWLRFAARLALERIPLSQWKSQVLKSDNPDIVTNGLLALYRLDSDAPSPNEALAIEWNLLNGKRGQLSRRQQMDVVRMFQLTHLAGADDPIAAKIGQKLMGEFPTGDIVYDHEIARTAVALAAPGTIDKIVNGLVESPSKAEQIYYALLARYISDGWTYEQKQRLLDWYESTRDWEGGHSMAGYISNIVGAGLDKFTPEDREAFIGEWRKRPFAAGMLIANSRPEEISEFEKVIQDVLGGSQSAEDYAKKEELVYRAIDALGRSASETTQPLLQQLYERFPDRREQLARTMAARPSVESWPYLVRSLETGDSTTKQFCIHALQQIQKQPDNPAPIRAAILTAMKLKGRAADNAINLLEQWTGSKPPTERDLQASIAYYQDWYGKKFPDAPPAELPKSSTESKYKYDQLLSLLTRPASVHQGDAEHGKQMFVKAQCIKCHRLMNEGETIGPDLTTLRRRFQRKEIVEALLFPSQVISDQYRPVTVVTVDGLVHTGMPISNPNKNDLLVLVLSDATKLQIPKDQIDETTSSTTSIMPEGVLDQLTLDEIVDLFAFLETSKYNSQPQTDPAVGDSSGK